MVLYGLELLTITLPGVGAVSLDAPLPRLVTTAVTNVDPTMEAMTVLMAAVTLTKLFGFPQQNAKSEKS